MFWFGSLWNKGLWGGFWSGSLYGNGAPVLDLNFLTGVLPAGVTFSQTTPSTMFGYAGSPTQLVTNGTFALNPLAPTQDTFLNGWEWDLDGGTASVTWDGSGAVTMMGDGTNASHFITSFSTTIGHTYEVAFGAGGNAVNISIGTAAFSGDVFSTNTTTGPQSYTFTATAASLFATLNKRTNDSGTTITNFSIIDVSVLLTYAPNNFLTQSNNFTSTAWTKVGSASISPGTLDPNGGTSAFTFSVPTTADGVYQGIPTNLGNTVLLSVWLQGSGTIFIGAFDNISGNQQTSVTLSSVWTQYFVKITLGAGSTDRRFYVTNRFNNPGTTTSVNVYFAVGSAVMAETTPRPQDQVITGASSYFGPRFDYNPATFALNGFLIEQASTNLIKTSNFGSSWAAFNTTLTNNTVASPDGTSDASTVLATAGAAVHGLFNNSFSGWTSATAYTYSVFLKQGTNQFAQIFTGSTAFSSNYANFDLQAGVVGTTGAGTTAAIQSVGNGWYRCSITMTAAATAADNTQVAIVNSASAAYQGSFTAAGTETIFVYQFDAIAASFPMSPIPTGAAQGPRGADVAFMPVSSFGYSGSGGTFASKFIFFGSANRIIGTSAVPEFSTSFFDGASVNFAPSGGFSPGSVYREVSAWDSSSARVIVNGNVGSFQSRASPNIANLSGITSIYFGSQGGTQQFSNAWIQRVQYFKQPFTQSKMISYSGGNW